MHLQDPSSPSLPPSDEPAPGRPALRSESDPTTGTTGTPPETKTGRKGELEPGEVKPLPS
jgi:hypothetical protein